MTDSTWLRLMHIGNSLGCHQMAERSFSFNGYQFPICARCTGVVIATIIATPLFFLYRISIILAILMSAIMFLDWFIQYANIRPSTNIRRLITGIIGGYGWTTLYVYFYYYIYVFFRENITLFY